MYAQQQQSQKKSRIALFPKKPEKQGTYVLTFAINITPELLQQINIAAQQHGYATDQYGQLVGVKLSGCIFQNEKVLSGSVNFDQQQQQQYAPQFQQPPQQFQQPPQQFQQPAPQQPPAPQYQQPPQQFQPQQQQPSAPSGWRLT